MSSHFQDVKDFHVKFSQIVGEQPQHLTARKLKERIEFMIEELLEFAVSCGLQVDIDSNNSADHKVVVTNYPLGNQDLPGQADALIDLTYVAMGTAVMLGLPWQALWDDVQRANMAKERGVTSRGHSFDVCKPPGWVPPYTTDILYGHGYRQTDWFKVSSAGGAYGYVLKTEECVDDPQPNQP